MTTATMFFIVKLFSMHAVILTVIYIVLNQHMILLVEDIMSDIGWDDILLYT